MGRSFTGSKNGAANADSGHWFNGVNVPEEPLWYVSSRDQSSGASYTIGVFGASNYTDPMAYLTNGSYGAVGSSGADNHIGASENPSRPIGYSTTLNTQTINPSAGYMGISCDGEGFNYRNEMVDSQGVIHAPSYNASPYNYVRGTIIGEPGYKSGLVLMRGSGNILNVVPKMSMPQPTSASKFSLNTAHFMTVGTTGGQSTGGVSYNRRANCFMLVEYRTAYNGFRLHVWSDLPGKIGSDTRALSDMLVACKAGGNYHYVDYVTDVAGGYAGLNDSGWYGDVVVVACDDGTAWLAHRYQSAMHLYAYDGEGVAHKRALTCNKSYTKAQGAYYSTKHQMSHDQSRVAIYAPYYYYLSGAALFICETVSATNYGYYRDTGTSNVSRSICPIGGPLFGMTCYSNLDGQTHGIQLRVMGQEHGGLIDTGLSLASNHKWINFHHKATSTNYSGVWINRIHHHASESTEYKEGLL